MGARRTWGARGSGPIAVLVAVLLSGMHESPSVEAGAPGSPRRATFAAPTALGRVFEANRSALVRVAAHDGDAGATGFLIGARGEVVFGASKAPSTKLRVTLEDGARLDAELLGFDRALGLALARITPDPSTPRHFTPLRPAVKRPMTRTEWVLVIKHDARGRPEPFAGEVDGEPAIEPKRATPVRPLVAAVLAPAAAGSPVFSVEGELIGVALEDGARRTKVAAIESLVPFFRAVVLGRDERTH